MNRPTSFDLSHAFHWFGRHADQLGASERKALEHVMLKRPMSTDPLLRLNQHATLGERVADAVDRQMAVHDYEVNLKAEIEIMALHEKMDALRTEQLAAMLAKQQEQIDLLTKLLARSDLSGRP